MFRVLRFFELDMLIRLTLPAYKGTFVVLGRSSPEKLYDMNESSSTCISIH